MGLDLDNRLKMDSIRSKMMSLSQATVEANSRAELYSEEIRKTNEVADKFEEQVIISESKKGQIPATKIATWTPRH